MLNWNDIVGLTISSVDEESAANVVTIKFTNGKEIMVDTDAIGYGLYRPVLYGKDKQ